MSSAIDRVGAFRGEILESGVGATKNGFPQFVTSLKATERWVDDAGEMEAFGLTEPGWVDWSGYDQTATGYLVLFGADRKKGTGYKSTFHIDNLTAALDWDGTALAALGSTDWRGTKVAFWIEENDYDGTISLQLQAIDSIDAPPVRALRKLDAAGLGDLDTKFAAFMSKKKTPTPAPAKAPAKAPPASVPAPAAAPIEKPAPDETSTAPAPPTTTTPPPVEAPPFEAEVMTQASAWQHVCDNRGDASDDAMGMAWIKTSNEVAPGKDETNMTGSEWSKIAINTVAHLASA